MNANTIWFVAGYILIGLVVAILYSIYKRHLSIPERRGELNTSIAIFLWPIFVIAWAVLRTGPAIDHGIDYLAEKFNDGRK